MSGEGNLARIFVKKLNYQYEPIIIQSNKFLKKYKFLNYKYISPLIGVIYGWYRFILGRKFSYVNYLPLWNFLIFLLLPPNTILGPITGGSKFSQNKKNFIRKIFFPLFYKMSELILKIRKIKAIFATDLLKDQLDKDFCKKSDFNFIFNALKKNKKNKKDIDFLIYYRKHKNKEDHFPLKFIKNLLDLRCSVHIIGNYLKLNGVKNHGYVNRAKLNYLLSKTKFTLGSGESLYTFFNIECINNFVKIILDSNYNFKIKFLKKHFYVLNFKKISSIRKIKFFISGNYRYR